jgi:hypothetical protein
VAEHRARAAGEHGRDRVRVGRDGAVPDGVHAAVEALEAADLQSVPDHSLSETEVQQLEVGHHAVLRARYRGDGSIDRF